MPGAQTNPYPAARRSTSPGYRLHERRYRQAARLSIVERIMQSKTHYQANICGGDFQHVKQCFETWKTQTLIYRRNQFMFEGKREVRPLAEGRVFDNGEVAQNVLAQTCQPRDPYAIAAEIRDGERDVWLVMAAYEE
jgi:hypothetical protein